MRTLGCCCEDAVSINSHKGNKATRSITLQMPERGVGGGQPSNPIRSQQEAEAAATFKVAGRRSLIFRGLFEQVPRKSKVQTWAGTLSAGPYLNPGSGVSSVVTLSKAKTQIVSPSTPCPRHTQGPILTKAHL